MCSLFCDCECASSHNQDARALSLTKRAAALEFIDSYPAECVRCYIDGSATEGTSDGGYGVYIEWKSQEMTRMSGPVGPRNVQLQMRKSDTARVHPHTEGTA
ncbi:hypothetical protein RRG08_003370 [Elysia crispata]|uniref:Uncharacterized protein n=1 Tax=Elysia crispata TaxID=231223 RepID=A0AAE1DVS9_9GAST|nr:hypothetical protein RRG08_003370 [Elysia crispata]